ncbi:DUF397 domain-containing protein [Streptomyces sp. HNM0645]
MEIAEAPRLVAVRGSEVPDGPHLTLTPAAFTAFAEAAARDGPGSA